MLQGYKPIEIGDKGTFDGLFKKHPPEISEFTFTNLYMWRNYYQFSWKVVDDCLILLSLKDASKIAVFPPVGENPAHALALIAKELRVEGKQYEWHRIPEAILPNFKQPGLHIHVAEDRDNWDYVYRSNDLSALEGSKYADFRKKLSRFNRDHDVEFKKLDTTTVGKCLEMQEEWCDLKACKENPGLSIENDAIEDAFEHWKTLGFSGCIMIENDRIVGYALGEWLNPSTFVCHVEKANPRPAYFGAYQAISKHFAENCAKGFEFINREQDLGEPGLRRAKEGYNPDHMVKKYKVSIK